MAKHLYLYLRFLANSESFYCATSSRKIPAVNPATNGRRLAEPLPRGPLLAAAGQGHRPPAPRAAEPSGDERPFERPLRPARCGGGRGSSRPKTAPRPQSPATTRHGGEGEAVASARRASAQKGGDEPGRQRATEGRDGAAHAEPNPQPRRPSHGGEGDGGGGMAAASPKSWPPPLHGREGKEGARAGPHPRPRPPAIPASRRRGGGPAPPAHRGKGRDRAAAAAAPRPPGDAANGGRELLPWGQRRRWPQASRARARLGKKPAAAVSPAAACSRMRPLLFGLAALAASSACACESHLCSCSP